MIAMRSPSFSASSEVVGDEDHRLLHLLLEADHLVLHVAADQRVERAERLVEQHDLGVGGERAGQADALLHPAGQLVGIRVPPPAEAHGLEHLVRLGLRAPSFSTPWTSSPNATLSTIRRCGSSPKCWNTMLILRAPDLAQPLLVEPR